MIKQCTITTAIVVLMAGCTWVKLEPGAEEVSLVGPEHVVNCEHLGKVTTSVRERVASVERKPGKVEQELADLARNSAIEIGGDTIVTDGPVTDGQRRFQVYRCRQ